MDFENRIVTPEYTGADAETEFSLRPRTLAEYIGQDKAKENLSIFIQAALMRGDSLDHVLLHGPPAMVSISVRKERYSHDIIKDSGEFVVNLTTRKLCYATDYCGVKSGRNTDKFADMHLTPQQSVKIAAPAIKESPVNIECKVKDIIELGSHDMFIAEVVAVNVDEKLLDSKGALRLQDADLIAYSHGQYYTLGDNIGKFGYSVKK